MKKPWYKRWTAWAIIIVALGIFGNLLPDRDAEPTAEPATTEETKSEAELAAEKANEEHTAAKAAEVKTEPVSTKPSDKKEEKPSKPADPPKPKTIQDVVTDVMGKDAYVDMYTEDGTVWVTVKLLDNWSAGWMLKGAYMDTLDISEQVVKHNLLNGAKELDIAFVTSFTDAYGNSSDGTAVEVTFNADTLAKINFDTVLHENVPVIADYYFEHPAFQAE
ncbi:hypothetical protein [Lysinibacillus sp.]|uniref:hypothetical protein n=1 Tax=Lysinibacillus sp. TaxID=1869345 RepID=UPI00289FC808|nr:hypothetical protein [Lysinibacillus sp.]